MFFSIIKKIVCGSSLVLFDWFIWTVIWIISEIFSELIYFAAPIIICVATFLILRKNVFKRNPKIQIVFIMFSMVLNFTFFWVAGNVIPLGDYVFVVGECFWDITKSYILLLTIVIVNFIYLAVHKKEIDT